ncbi:MAG: gamma-glutamylcyclotransferase [Desulfomonile tiedjei]|nr:gamma-glutamylcyclotransferase [Desulfomonile tiedjei]
MRGNTAKESLRDGVILGTVILSVLCWCGCVALTKEAARAVDQPPGKSAKAQGEQAGQDGKKKTSKASEPATSTKTGETSHNDENSASNETEDQAIERMARELVAKTPKTVGVKICYDKKADEWWITLYEDAGAALDLKQYVWGQPRDKLEQFLVVKKVGKRKLADDLASAEPGMSCRSIKPTKEVHLAAGAESKQPVVEEPSRKPPVSTPAAQRRGGETLAARTHQTTPVPDKKPTQPTATATPSSSDNTTPIFLYGADMNYSVLRTLLKGTGLRSDPGLEGTAARLDGYDFLWNFYSESRGGGIVNLVPRTGSSVWGVLLKADAEILKALDRRAASSSGYHRQDRKVEVHTLRDRKSVQAWIYVAGRSGGGRKDVWPSAQYKQQILTAATFWGLPDAYLEKIKAWPTHK